MKSITVIGGGYGVEISVGSITKEQYEYWSNDEIEKPCTVEQYAFSPEDYEVPDNIAFPDHITSWYDNDDIINWWGQNEDSWFIIEIDGESIVDYKDLSEISKEFATDEDEEDVIYESIKNYVPEKDIFETTLESGYYIVSTQVEKGEFFSGSLEFDEDVEFDIKKLKFSFIEIMDECLLYSVEYDGEEIENGNGGATNPKGFYVDLIKVD